MPNKIQLYAKFNDSDPIKLEEMEGDYFMVTIGLKQPDHLEREIKPSWKIKDGNNSFELFVKRPED